MGTIPNDTVNPLAFANGLVFGHIPKWTVHSGMAFIGSSVAHKHARAERRPMLEDLSKLGPLLEHNRVSHHFHPYPLLKHPF